MPLMAYVPSRPVSAGPAKVIATDIECLLARSFLRASCFALGVAEAVGRADIGEAARLREGSAGAAHGWAAIRFPWPGMVFGMRAALPSTGELPPARRPGG